MRAIILLFIVLTTNAYANIEIDQDTINNVDALCGNPQQQSMYLTINEETNGKVKLTLLNSKNKLTGDAYKDEWLRIEEIIQPKNKEHPECSKILVPVFTRIFLNSTYKFSINNKDFYIEKHMHEKHPELISLISNTESMNDKERQYWFDLMPVLPSNHIERLFNILENERKKLEELEVKYQKEIKELNEKHLPEWGEFQFDKNYKEKTKNNISKFVGLYFLQKDDGGISPFKVSKITDNNKNNIKSIITSFHIEQLQKDQKIKDIEELIIIRYGQEVFSNFDKYKELYNEEMIDSYANLIGDIAARHNDIGLMSLISSRIPKKDFNLDKYMGNYDKVADKYYNELIDSKWKDNLINNLFNMTLWRHENKCKNKCTHVLSAYFDKMLKENYPFSIKDVNEKMTFGHIKMDFVNYFNADIIDSNLRNKINDFIKINYKRHEENPTKQSLWEHSLVEAFFNGNIDEIFNKKSQEYNSLAASINNDTINKALAMEGDLLEAGTYHAIYLIKNKKRENATEILEQLKKLGTSYQSSAYDYVEKDIVDFLVKTQIVPNFNLKGVADIGFLDEDNPQNIQPYGKKYAIIIGISDYKDLQKPTENTNEKQNTLIDLKYADLDATGFQEFINDPTKSGGGWEVKTFTNNTATTLDVRKAIDEITHNAMPNDLIYIFFSGHARVSSYHSTELYLLTYDFKNNDPYSGIPYDWFKEKISETSAGHVVVFIDACRSGAVNGKGGDALFDQGLLTKILKESPTKIIFTSGSGTQVSYEDDSLKHGIFTYYLLEGISGDAPDEHSKDGFVNLNELEYYVRDKVSTYTRKEMGILQEPRINNLNKEYSTQIPISLR